MRIKSPFRDYYDGVGQNGIDHEILYLRKTVKVGLGCPPSIYDGVLSNLIFPYSIPVRSKLGECFPVTYQFWRIGAQLFRSIKVDNKIFFARSRLKEAGWNLGYVGSMFDRKDFFDQDYSLPAITEPVYLIESSQSSKWPYTPTLTLNPNLSQYNFGAVLPPTDAWQAIYTYLCNQARPERPIPEMSNDIKVSLAGFDVKKSFRKEKE